MMPDNNPFLEGYKAAILGKSEICPYEDGTPEYERWCRGFGRTPEVLQAAARKPSVNPALEGRRPFVEGYMCAILGKNDACPYEDGTAEYERWWKGFRGRGIQMGAAVRKPVVNPYMEGRRPFVEGYISTILGKSDACPYEDGTAEFERWWQGTRRPVAAKAPAGLSARL
jgi:ribosome modulation factor